jgi:hypothetical protein
MDLLNDFIKQNFSGKSICELAQIEQKLQDTKELLKWIDKCSVLEGELLKKDEERDVYKQATKEWKRALEIACEELEALKPQDKMCIMAVIDEETAAHCSGQNDCDECLKWHFLKRAVAVLRALENNRIVKDEIAGRKRMDEQDTKQTMKENIGGKSI